MRTGILGHGDQGLGKMALLFVLNPVLSAKRAALMEWLVAVLEGKSFKCTFRVRNVIANKS